MDDNRAVVGIDELCAILDIGKNTAYMLLNSSEIDSFRIGMVWKIPKKSIEDYIQRKCMENRRFKVMCKIVN